MKNQDEVRQANRVRENTEEEVNRKIDKRILKRIERSRNLTGQGLSQRIRKLERKWDIERALEFNASTLALAGLVLGASVNKKWFLLPAVVTAFLLQHAIQGWCPPLPVLRKLGFRTRQEIEEERLALKLLREDFKELSSQSDAKKMLENIRE